MSMIPLLYPSIMKMGYRLKGIRKCAMRRFRMTIPVKAEADKCLITGADFDGDMITSSPLQHRIYKRRLRHIAYSKQVSFKYRSIRRVSIRQKANPFKQEHPK